MSKAIAEQSNAISIFWLKKHGYLHKDYGYQSGRIVWTYGYDSDYKSSIDFAITRNNWGTSEEKTYLKLNYTHTNQWTDEKSDMNFKISLTITPCNYGGARYWFICPLTKNEKYCGRRVGVLFSIGKWFGCRHCAKIAYSSQMRGGKYRGSSVCLPDIEKVEKEVKRYYYNGKPTRKYRRVIQLNEKLNQSFMLMAARADKRFGRLAGLKKK